MKLSDLYTSLSYGALNNLSIGGDGSGTIPAKSEDRILHFITQGLTALHTRFRMKVKEVVVQSYDGQTIYRLDPKFAHTNSEMVPKKYIADSIADPFVGDVIKIILVADELGDQLPLNESADDWSLFTPTPTSLQIPRALTGNAYFILYQADHPPLAKNDLDQEVNIPGMLQEPLELYVASRVLSSMNGQEHAAKGAELLQRYEQICGEIELKDLLSTSLVEASDKFEERGFK